MTSFLYVTCGGVSKLTDICLAILRTTQSHVELYAIYLAHNMLHTELSICNMKVETDSVWYI